MLWHAVPEPPAAPLRSQYFCSITGASRIPGEPILVLPRCKKATGLRFLLSGCDQFLPSCFVDHTQPELCRLLGLAAGAWPDDDEVGLS